MWKNTDKELKKFNKDYLKENKKTLDEFQNVFDGTETLDGSASKNDLERFKRRVNSNYEYLSDYGKYQANKYLKKRRISNSEIFWFTLFMIYAYQQYKILQLQMAVFMSVANDIYNSSTKELEKDFKKQKGRFDLDSIVNHAIDSPNSKGYVWQDYNDATMQYNTNELYNLSLQHLRENKPLKINDRAFKKLIKKQNNRLICINGDKISGAMDNETIYIANNVKTELYIFYGVEKCKFIAVKDKATTRMCESLDGQVFNIHDWNEFRRYSATNGAITKYRVYGMIPGVNLPPIDDHFHYCRSTITYLLNDNVVTDTRNKLIGKAEKERERI